MHALLQLQFGNEYAVDVRTFDVRMLEQRPLQQLDE